MTKVWWLLAMLVVLPAPSQGSAGPSDPTQQSLSSEVELLRKDSGLAYEVHGPIVLDAAVGDSETWYFASLRFAADGVLYVGSKTITLQIAQDLAPAFEGQLVLASWPQAAQLAAQAKPGLLAPRVRTGTATARVVAKALPAPLERWGRPAGEVGLCAWCSSSSRK